MTVRLYDTSTRSLAPLPEPPARVGMYVCGPTVYQRAHIGNGRPFVVFSWLRNWLRDRGYDVTYVHNITDINDKIYEAAPGHSAERAAEATQWYLEMSLRSVSGCRIRCRSRPRRTPRSSSSAAELIASGHAYEAGGEAIREV